ncbi:hypothetical protein JZ751_015408, partial [Albula glossodonta]
QSADLEDQTVEQDCGHRLQEGQTVEQDCGHRPQEGQPFARKRAVESCAAGPAPPVGEGQGRGTQSQFCEREWTPPELIAPQGGQQGACEEPHDALFRPEGLDEGGGGRAFGGLEEGLGGLEFVMATAPVS